MTELSLILRQQLSRHGVQIDLVPQPGPKRLDHLGGVVATPVEPSVHGLLDAAAGRVEQCGHGQGRGGNHDARALREEPAQAQHHRGVATQQQGLGAPARVTTSSNTTGAPAVIPAHQRQRAEGRSPVGVSSRMNPLQAIAATMVAGT
jgi:hypothetical protein